MSLCHPRIMSSSPCRGKPALGSARICAYTPRMTDEALSQRLQDALARHQAGDLAMAEAGYLSVLSDRPGHVDALYLLSTLRLQQGRAEDALALSEQVIAHVPRVADAHANKGTALQALQRFDDAAAAFRAAIQLAPDAAHLYFNLGNALRAAGDKPGAVTAYRDAVALKSDLVQALSNLGATLSELGHFDEAAVTCAEACRLAPSFADAHYNLGNAHREAGRFDDAVASFQAALAQNPEHANAHCNLGLALMRHADLGPAIDALAEAMRVAPEHNMAAFYHAVATEMSGADADALFAAMNENNPTVHAWLDSWHYIKSNSTLASEIIHDPFRLLRHAFDAAPETGLILEFGVRHGVSLRHIAAMTTAPVHGFDSFQGLPTAWGDEPEGVYSTEGALPQVPGNVTLHAGLFEDTLADFLVSHPGNVRFCNIDCDIYDSAVTVLEGLAPRIGPGTVLVFDEYLVNPSWRDDEYRAFQQAVTRYGWRYSYIAFGIVTKQAAVRIESV